MKKFSTLMRALAVAMLMLVGGMTVSASTIYLRTVSSADQSVALGEIQTITFGDQNVSILLTDNSTIECSLSDFRSLRTNEDGTPGGQEKSAITDLKASETEAWSVYDLRGNLLGNADAIAAGKPSLSKSLAPGVYIVKSKSQTLKLIVR